MKNRRSGRQIPADLAILSVFSLSLLLGLPLARRLHLIYPTMNRGLFLAIGFVVGLAILGALYGVLNFGLRWWSKKQRK